ncbi:MAG: lipid-A-disaccharide synthase N-terminal domain-containing protein [Phycisphaerales bacterium]|nr:lipid-A-disaccharide synthase N-terminal domain-containing protein [Phycisphaerales bacterium]
MKRFKWEPVAALVAVIALGLWLVWGPSKFPGIGPLREGARTVELRIGNDRGVVEIVDDGPTFRLLFRDGSASAVMSAAELERVIPGGVVQELAAQRANWLFRIFNITGWGSLVWIAVGLGGQLAFSGRMLVQWVASEKSRRSVVPEVFWWMSLAGGAALFAYFAWRQDIVGVLGQSSGLVIYARNLRLIHKQKGRDRRSALRSLPSGPAEGADGVSDGGAGAEVEPRPGSRGRAGV